MTARGTKLPFVTDGQKKLVGSELDPGTTRNDDLLGKSAVVTDDWTSAH
jgi:hypothetical protein